MTAAVACRRAFDIAAHAITNAAASDRNAVAAHAASARRVRCACVEIVARRAVGETVTRGRQRQAKHVCGTRVGLAEFRIADQRNSTIERYSFAK